MATNAATGGSKPSHAGSDIGTYVSGASTNVSIGGGPAATVGTIYHCPKSGHAGNYAVVSGSATVKINGKAAAGKTSALAAPCGALLDQNDVTSVTIG